MIRNISVGIDVGTHTTRVVVCEFPKGETVPRIIGSGSCHTSGMRHGYIVNFKEAVSSIKKAVLEAENTSGIKIKRAFVSIGGITLSSETNSGIAIISKADSEVTSLDVAKAMKESEDNLALGNKKIIHAFPISYKLDGKEIPGRPEGLKGVKLEIKVLFVSCLSQHIEDLVSATIEAGIEPIDIIASPVAASAVAISERQKMVGCALVNIGAETVSIAVFENGMLSSLQVFSIGSTDITNDIALGLKIPLEEAEGLKLGSIIGDYPKKKLDEIIEARLSDIFELIDNHLKKIKRSALLPAGIIITGGGAGIAGIEELSKAMLKLPTKIGGAEIFQNQKGKIRDSSWFVASGLCFARQNGAENYSSGSFSGMFKDIKNAIKSMTKQLMP